jgi:outer membrane protein
MPRPSLRALLVALSFTALVASRAQDQTPAPVPVPPPAGAPAAAVAAAAAPETAPSVPALTLEECILRAIQHNFDLRIQNYNTETAKETLNIAKAGFDPNFSATARRTINQAASSTSSLDGTTSTGLRTDGTSASVGYTQFVSTGATLNVNSNLNRAATNSSFATLNPSFGSNISVGASQPLLRGAGRNANLALVRISQIGVNIANLGFKGAVLQVIHDTEVAYYNLAFDRDQLIVKQHSLELARALFDENTTRKNTGVATDLDVVSAEVGVANARLGVVQAEQAVANGEDALLNLTGPANFNQRPGAVHFSDFPDHPPSFDISYKLTRDNDPDYATSLAVINQDKLNADSLKQFALPTVNLDGTVGYNATDDSYSNVLNDLPERKGYNWTIGVTVGVPWGLHADRARYRSAIATLRQQQAKFEQLDQNLVVNVRSAVRAVETNITSVQIAAKATELSERQYNLQKARLDAGLSTSRLVLEAQDDLETAHVNELQARVNLGAALAALHQLEGSSIDQYKIILPQ